MSIPDWLMRVVDEAIAEMEMPCGKRGHCFWCLLSDEKLSALAEAVRKPPHYWLFGQEAFDDFREHYNRRFGLTP